MLLLRLRVAPFRRLPGYLGSVFGAPTAALHELRRDRPPAAGVPCSIGRVLNHQNLNTFAGRQAERGCRVVTTATDET
jgi:hypothetical protein